MKRRKIVLKNKGILFSLLLSSGVMAATENLNLNYEREGILSLEPRLGLQAKACHSKVDPMTIRVRFGEMYSSAPIIKLTIEGADYRKSYSVFSATKGGGDTDFVVPWNVSVNGKVSGTATFNEDVPGVAAEYKHAFCFADGYIGNAGPGNGYYSPNTHGYYPLFEDYIPQEIIDNSTTDAVNLNRSEFKRLCGGRSATQDIDHVWSTSIPGSNRPLPDNIEIAMNKYGDAVAFLKSGLFYLDYTPPVSQSTRPASASVPQPPAIDQLPVSSAGVVSYNFPIAYPKGYTLLSNGDFLLTLSNRNISKLSLTIGDTIWSWESSNKDSPQNNLYLIKNNVNVIEPGIANLALLPGNDPFREMDDALPDNFYKDDYLKGGAYFRGTLVKSGFLSQMYTDYIKNTKWPLSLPADIDGTINLVNTDSLTFIIGQDRHTNSQGNFYLRVSGQPLQFAPLYINGSEAVSAMQLRNVCY
ncbi:hypothetical protein K4955_002022 [Salmonella enterica]|nr:hypothetical protein [Salmonella enterica]